MKRWMLAAMIVAVGASCTAGDRPTPRMSEGAIPGERISTDDALPAEFPTDITLPADHQVLYSAVGPNGVSAFLQSALAVEDLKGRTLAGMESQGWVLTACQHTDRDTEPLVITTFRKDDRTASIVIGYSEEFAARIDGEDYAMLISVTDTSRGEPVAVEPC